MGYQLGASTSTLVDTTSVFHTDVAAMNFVAPRSTPVAGGEEYTSMDGLRRWRGFKRSRWNFSLLALSSYEMAVAILCSLAGTGTVSPGTDPNTLEGSGTAFTTELAVGDTLIVHLGSGVYEHFVVTAIADNTHLTTSSDPVNGFSGATFRYRPQSTYSGDCYISTLSVTHDGANVYQTFSAVAICPDPSKLTRSGRRYESVDIEFLLKAVA
jgi:hypothetical protein